MARSLCLMRSLARACLNVPSDHGFSLLMFAVLQLFSVAVREGDMIIAVTDGVSDNVFPREAAAVANTLQQRGCTPQVIANGLARFARYKAEDETYMSPFAVAARQQTRHAEALGGAVNPFSQLMLLLKGLKVRRNDGLATLAARQSQLLFVQKHSKRAPSELTVDTVSQQPSTELTKSSSIIIDEW